MRRIALLVTTAAMLTIAAAGSTAATFPEVIALPNGWLPEGIAISPGGTFYSGSRANGAGRTAKNGRAASAEAIPVKALQKRERSPKGKPAEAIYPAVAAMPANLKPAAMTKTPPKIRRAARIAIVLCIISSSKHSKDEPIAAAPTSAAAPIMYPL